MNYYVIDFVKARSLALLLLLVAFAGLGCVTFDTNALRGLSGLELRRCLGVPDAFEVDGESEYIVYHRAINRGARIEYDPRDRTMLMHSARAVCSWVFRFGEKGLEELGVRGLDDWGLNADHKCLMTLRRCTAPEDR